MPHSTRNNGLIERRIRCTFYFTFGTGNWSLRTCDLKPSCLPQSILEEEEVIPETQPKEPTPKRKITSTPKKDTPKRARVANRQECLKEHMDVEGTAVASTASTWKM